MASRNKKKLIKIILGNLSNAILHEILANSAIEELRGHYEKEVKNSITIAIKYRNKLSSKWIINDNIKVKLIRIVKIKLNGRIRRGYNLDLDCIEDVAEYFIRKL